MMNKIASLISVTILILLFPSAIQAQETTITPLGDLNERLENTARISGNIVSGFTAIGNTSNKRPFLEAFIPSSWSGEKFCISLVSDDGLYEGSREFEIQENWEGGKLEIPLESQFSNYLANTNDDQFAALVSKGLCGNERNEITTAGWNEEISEEITTFQILLNSYRADETYLIINKISEVNCIEIDSSKRTAFDYKCLIPIDIITNSGPTEIEINRIRRGVYDSSLVVLISTN